MNLALEKGERVTTGGKDRGEAGEVTGVVANALTMDGLGKSYGTFGGWGMAAGKVEVLLVVGGFDVDGGAEARLVNKTHSKDGATHTHTYTYTHRKKSQEAISVEYKR